ncbi:hypothetical protein DER44DRAFT_239054 [Fusarium oxysporum]|nr:hypothetical protein DER44DRAFT_239054 [Fusarium oxysporum]
MVELLAILMEIMLLDGSQSLPAKPIGSAITSDQLVTLSSGGFAFLYIPSQQLHYQIPQIIQLPLNPLERLAHARPIGLRCALWLATDASEGRIYTVWRSLFHIMKKLRSELCALKRRHQASRDPLCVTDHGHARVNSAKLEEQCLQACLRLARQPPAPAHGSSANASCLQLSCSR